MVGTGSALLLAALAVTIVANWPDRATDANPSWYSVTVVRATGVLLLAGWAGASALRVSPRRRYATLVEPLTATVITAPIEALAYFGSAPAASLAWSITAPIPLVLAAFGTSWTLAAIAYKLRLGWALPLLLPAAAVGLVVLDVRIGPVLWIPWLLPFSPSWSAATLLTGLAVATVVALARIGVAGKDAA